VIPKSGKRKQKKYQPTPTSMRDLLWRNGLIIIMDLKKEGRSV